MSIKLSRIEIAAKNQEFQNQGWASQEITYDPETGEIKGLTDKGKKLLHVAGAEDPTQITLEGLEALKKTAGLFEFIEGLTKETLEGKEVRKAKDILKSQEKQVNKIFAEASYIKPAPFYGETFGDLSHTVTVKHGDKTIALLEFDSMDDELPVSLDSVTLKKEFFDLFALDDDKKPNLEELFLRNDFLRERFLDYGFISEQEEEFRKNELNKAIDAFKAALTEHEDQLIEIIKGSNFIDGRAGGNLREIEGTSVERGSPQFVLMKFKDGARSSDKPPADYRNSDFESLEFNPSILCALGIEDQESVFVSIEMGDRGQFSPKFWSALEESMKKARSVR